jgi:hypothetical protein
MVGGHLTPELVQPLDRQVVLLVSVRLQSSHHGRRHRKRRLAEAELVHVSTALDELVAVLVDRHGCRWREAADVEVDVDVGTPWSHLASRSHRKRDQATVSP